MTEEEIYQLWHTKTNNDPRYLRPLRWKQLKDLILSKGVKTILEFGSGVSTLLLDQLNIKIHSVETDRSYMRTVQSLCSSNIEFTHWDNEFLQQLRHYDLAIVDGDLPRDRQLIYAIALSDYIAIDDYRKDEKATFGPLLINYKQVNDKSTPLAIFSHR